MNLKKIPLTFPCHCGHSKKMHIDMGSEEYEGWCNGMNKRDKWFCGCEDYKPDNLKFLEQRFKEKRKKIKK